MVIILNDFCNIFNFPLIIFSDFIFYTFQSLIYYITKIFDFFYVTTIFNFYSIFFCILDNCCIMGFFSIICPLFFFWKPSYFCCCITHNRFGFSPVYILIIIYSVLHFVFVLLLNFFVIYQKLCVKLSNFWFFCLSFLYIWNYLVFILSLEVCDHLLWLFIGMSENFHICIFICMVYMCSQLFSLIFVIYLEQYKFVPVLLIFSLCVWNMCLLLISCDLCINLWGVVHFGFFFCQRNSLNICLCQFFCLFLHWSHQLLELLKIYYLFDLVSCSDHCRNSWWFLDFYWWFHYVEQ